MKYRNRTFALCGLSLLGACADRDLPPSVDEFVADRIMLDAALVRCAQNRPEMKYEAECVVAREAVNVIASQEEAERRQKLEAQSERKRTALRRAQEAADEARRRAAEAERLRQEAEYLAQFNAVPGDGTAVQSGGEAGGAVAEPPPAPREQPMEPADDAPTPVSSDPAEPAEPATAGAGDLQAIRDELQRRQNDRP